MTHGIMKKRGNESRVERDFKVLQFTHTHTESCIYLYFTVQRIAESWTQTHPDSVVNQPLR